MARRSGKVHTRTLADGTPPMSFTRLLAHLATIVRNTLRPKGARPGEASFTLTTRPTAKQQQALDLIADITVYELVRAQPEALRGSCLIERATG